MGDHEPDHLLTADTLQPPLQPETSAAPARLPTLTMLAHPHASRVGERAHVAPLARRGGVAGVSRTAPDFRATLRSAARPLTCPFLSRRPVVLTAVEAGAVHVNASSTSTRVRVDGAPLPPGA